MIKKLVLIGILFAVSACLAVNYCPKCGEPVPEDSSYCPNCGHALATAAAPRPTAATPAVAATQKGMGDVLILPRCGWLTDFDDDWFAFGGELGYNIVNDVFFAVSLTFGGWKENYAGYYVGTESSYITEIFGGAKWYMGSGIVKFAVGQLFGFVDYEYTDDWGTGRKEVSGGGFAIRENLGLAVLFADFIGMEIGFSFDMVFFEDGTSFLIYPGLGVLLTF